MSAKKKISIYLLFVLSLLIGYFFNENASGGAKIDNNFLIPFINQFSIDFNNGFDFYLNNNASKIHSPVFYLIIASLFKLFQNIYLVNIIYLFISSALPYLFYLVLKNRVKTNTNYIFYISILIFISPYFRSTAIWMLGDNLSLIFFCLSIFFYLRIENDKSLFSNYILCLFFLICCCYIRYYYSIFYLFYLFYFYKKISFKQFGYLIIFSFLISMPALYYFYYIFFSHEFVSTLNTFGALNYYSNALQILSILFFYLFPFVIFRFYEFMNYYKYNPKIFYIFSSTILSLFIVDYFTHINLIDLSQFGGGVFKKFAELINISSSIFLSFISLLSLLILDFIFKENRLHNYILLFILIICLPLATIYQKYLDPLFFLFFFGLVKSDFVSDILKKESSSILFLFIYFGSFLIFSINYYF